MYVREAKTGRARLSTVEGYNDAIDFRFLRDDDHDSIPETAQSLSAFGTVELWREDNRGTVDHFTNISGTATLTFPSGWQAAGSVRWIPGSADLKNAYEPYICMFKLIGTAGTAFAPHYGPFSVSVRPRVA